MWPYAKEPRWAIAVDFDGVLHSYTTPWVAVHVIPDPPVDGSIEWLHEMVQRFRVHVISTRGRTWRGRRAMRVWLRENADWRWYGFAGRRGLRHVHFSRQKDPALVYIDDRAWRFEGPGTFPSVDDVHRSRPWNRR